MTADLRRWPRAILFDLYETLVTHFDPQWVPPLRSIAERLGLEELAFKALWPRFDKAWQSGEISDYEEALARVCAAAHRVPNSSLLVELASERRAAYRRPFEAIEPQIIDMVVKLRGTGLKLGVITNASNLDAAPWPASSLAPFFDCFVASHQVGLLKPDRRIYALACRRLDVPPGDAIFVGDGGSNELSGAIQAGLGAYWCTWFLDRWPAGRRPNSFTGDAWRQNPLSGEPPCERLAQPPDLLNVLGLE